jgi:hypothetical protein
MVAATAQIMSEFTVPVNTRVSAWNVAAFYDFSHIGALASRAEGHLLSSKPLFAGHCSYVRMDRRA